MKYILVIGLLIINLFSSNLDNTCKSCHLNIYNEYYSSIHSASAPKDDTIHKAVWDKHPNKAKNDYTCKECHTPKETEKSISCVDCHTISSIKEDKIHNHNVRTTKEKYFYSADTTQKGQIKEFKKDDSFMGLFSKKSGSPYHTIDYSNQDFYNSKVCMGCHSHNQNKQNIDSCRVSFDGNISQNNCITCHMPQVNGSATSIKITKTHAFHGFAGVHNAPQMLSKYLAIKISQTKNGFDVSLHNLSPHPFLLQPLRVAMLNIKINSKKLTPIVFARILGDEKDNPAMPWNATKVLSDTMLKANEKRSFHFSEKLKSSDSVEAEFGFFVVNPKVKEKLELQNDKTANKFTVFKSEILKIK
jgi:hypothetical protein